jgi:hypothetical protein
MKPDEAVLESKENMLNYFSKRAISEWRFKSVNDLAEKVREIDALYRLKSKSKVKSRTENHNPIHLSGLYSCFKSNIEYAVFDVFLL